MFHIVNTQTYWNRLAVGGIDSQRRKKKKSHSSVEMTLHLVRKFDFVPYISHTLMTYMSSISEICFMQFFRRQSRSGKKAESHMLW